jgi:hypothetical protein
MTAGGHEMPPHLARYVDGLTGPGRVTISTGSDIENVLDAAGESGAVPPLALAW